MSTPFKPFRDTRSQKKKTEHLIFSILIALLAVFPFLQVLHYHKNPMDVIDEYTFEWFCLAAGLLIIGLAFGMAFICKLLGGRRCEFINTGSIICFAVMTVVLLFFIYSMLTFGGRLGAVSIKTASDFEYIENYRFGDYSISNDIDAKELYDVSISGFSGELDGNGHAINGLKLADKPLFKSNSGEIHDITFNDPSLPNALIKNNSGTVKNITVNNPKPTLSFVNKNRGTINNVVINNPEILFDTESTLGVFACENTANGEIRNCTANGIKINSEAEVLDYSADDASPPSCESFGGIAGDNKGTIANCTVAGLTTKYAAADNFGGIVGVNGTEKSKATVYNCTAKDINVSIKCEGSFGGIAGKGFADYTACHTGGTANVFGENTVRVGGIGGELSESSTVKHSQNVLDINLTVNETDFSSSKLSLGGIAGSLRYNTLISASQNRGNLTATIKGLRENTDFYMGGAVGMLNCAECRVEDSVNYANVKLNKLDFEKHSDNNLYVGGFVGAFNKDIEDVDGMRLSIDNCYSTGNLETAYKDVAAIGGLQAYRSNWTNANITDSFFVGKIIKPKDLDNGNCWITSQAEGNNYYSSGCGYKNNGYEAADSVKASKLKDATFIKDTLKWDEAVWDIKSGSFPMLKAYEVEKDETVDAQINEDAENELEKALKDKQKLIIIVMIGAAIALIFCIIIERKNQGRYR